MGKHLNKLKKLDRILGKFQKIIRELSKITDTIREKGKPDKQLTLFVFAYALLNYQFSMYLIKIFPKTLNSDKIDKQFGNIMKSFDKRKRKKR